MVDRESQQKLYVQIYAIIKTKIERGEWLAGAQIPTEDTLCRTYDVSKATVRLAVSELARDGYLRRVQGKGTFVLYSIPSYSGIAMKTRLTGEMLGEGVKVKKEIVRKGVKKPAEDIKTYFGFDDDVYYVLCKRVAEDEPAYLEESFIPLFVVPDIEVEDFCQHSLYELIQTRSMRKIHKVVQTLEVTEINGDSAAILRIKEGSPVLLLHRLLIGSDRTPLAYTRLIGSGRKYKIQTEFEKIK
jgi:GntR family transcriptional regulator